MNVKELKEFLKDVPEDTPIVVRAEDGDYLSASIRKARIFHDTAWARYDANVLVLEGYE